MLLPTLELGDIVEFKPVAVEVEVVTAEVDIEVNALIVLGGLGELLVKNDAAEELSESGELDPPLNEVFVLNDVPVEDAVLEYEDEAEDEAMTVLDEFNVEDGYVVDVVGV